jgi:hypothetical protein
MTTIHEPLGKPRGFSCYYIHYFISLLIRRSLPGIFTGDGKSAHRGGVEKAFIDTNRADLHQLCYLGSFAITPEHSLVLFGFSFYLFGELISFIPIITATITPAG